MQIEIPSLNILFVAQVTSVRFLSSILTRFDSRMLLEILNLCKLFFSYVSNIWFLTGVDEHVIFEMAALRKSFRTYFTNIWFLTSVD